MAPKKQKRKRETCRSRRVIMQDVLTETKPSFATSQKPGVCGACLLSVGATARVGLIDSCSHVFHYDCIRRWSQTENSCPQCKLRFFWLAAYTPGGRREKLEQVERRDQEGEEEDDVEDVQPCEACNQVGDERTLLLCDGMHGTCNAAYHFTCVGLSAVPRGSWFCPDCIDRGFDTDARGRRSCSTALTSPANPPQSGNALETATAPPQRQVGGAAAATAAPAPTSSSQAPPHQAVSSTAATVDTLEALPATAVRDTGARTSGSSGGPSTGAQRSGGLPPHLRLSAFACASPAGEVPSLAPPEAGAGGREGGLFASFVQRRRVRQRTGLGGPSTAAAPGEAGFISLNPTYEQDFMGGKVNS